MDKYKVGGDILHENKIALFEEKEIRRTWQDEKWYFSIEDIVYVLTDSKDPKQYIKKMKARDEELKINWGTICTHVKAIAKDGKKRLVQMADTEGILRIIQSIPSKKAEPFKRWLAKVGKERIDEINNPELAMDRMKRLYEQKGYSKAWIEQRERGITTRHNLVDEWKERGASNSLDYAILTNEIYKSGFGLTAKEYKKIKKIHESKNLRDSMTNIELALTNLAEASAVEIHKSNESVCMNSLKKDANDAGKVMKKAKDELEDKIKRPVVSSENHLNLTNKNRLN